MKKCILKLQVSSLQLFSFKSNLRKIPELQNRNTCRRRWSTKLDKQNTTIVIFMLQKRPTIQILWFVLIPIVFSFSNPIHYMKILFTLLTFVVKMWWKLNSQNDLWILKEIDTNGQLILINIPTPFDGCILAFWWNNPFCGVSKIKMHLFCRWFRSV